MVSSDLLLVAGGLAAAEATGLTDFVGGGGGDDKSTPSTGIPPGLLRALANQSGAGAQGVQNALADLRADVAAARGAAETATTIAAVTGQDGGGGGTTTIVPTIPNWLTRTPNVPTTVPDWLTGGGGGGGGGPTTVPTTGTTGGMGGGGQYDLQSTYGRGPVENAFALIGEGGTAIGESVNAVGGWVGENPIATGGLLLGAAAAPFTGGASIPLALAAGGGVGEVGTDLATGQYGDVTEGITVPTVPSLDTSGWYSGATQTLFGVTPEEGRQQYGGGWRASFGLDGGQKDDRDPAPRGQTGIAAFRQAEAATLRGLDDTRATGSSPGPKRRGSAASGREVNRSGGGGGATTVPTVGSRENKRRAIQRLQGVTA